MIYIDNGEEVTHEQQSRLYHLLDALIGSDYYPLSVVEQVVFDSGLQSGRKEVAILQTIG